MGQIEIIAVPPNRLDQVFEHAAPWLARGLAAANIPLREGVDRILFGDAVLWLIAEIEPSAIRGAFLTEITDGPTVTVAGLAGEQLPRWAKQLDARMGEVASAAQCRAVKFAGRRGWGRVLPSYSAIGESMPGVTIFERAVS